MFTNEREQLTKKREMFSYLNTYSEHQKKLFTKYKILTISKFNFLSLKESARKNLTIFQKFLEIIFFCSNFKNWQQNNFNIKNNCHLLMYIFF